MGRLVTSLKRVPSVHVFVRIIISNLEMDALVDSTFCMDESIQLLTPPVCAFILTSIRSFY
jgi:hypothetical protein